MKKHLFLILLALPLFLLANEKITPLKTQKVTVFLEGAQITATANASLAEGNNQLIFSNLSPNIRQNSIQVKGLNRLSLNFIQFDVTFLKKKELSAEMALMNEQIEVLKEKIALKQSAIDALETEDSLLMQNKNIASTEANSTLAKLKEYANYYRERSEEIYNGLYQLKKEQNLFQKEMNNLQREITYLDSRNETSRGEIKLLLNSEIAQNASLEISYLVEDAGWFPKYEIRAKDATSPVRFLYQANVFQNTGADWKDVELTLSTADPSVMNQKPKISPYYLNFNVSASQQFAASKQSKYKFNPYVRNVQGVVTDSDGIPLPSVQVSIVGKTRGTQTDFDGNYSLQIPIDATQIVYEYIGFSTLQLHIYAQSMNVSLEPGRLDEVVVTGYASRRNLDKFEDAESKPINQVQKTEQLTAINFKLPKKYSIASAEEPLKLKLDQQEIAAVNEYYTAPVLDTEVYLTATLKDWQSLDLLPGEASIYFEDTFTGQVFIDANMNTEDFVVALGSDQNIVVERIQGNKLKSKSFFRNNSIVEKEYEISIKNNKSEDVVIKLEDRLPISQNSDIKVSDQRYADASLEEETGVLTWNLQVNAKSKQTKKFAYKVTYPKGERVNIER